MLPPHDVVDPLPEVAIEQKTPLENKEQQARRWREGLFWALLSPVFLGTIPIFAKLAYAAGANVLTVVAFRTLFAAAVLWTAVLIFAPHFIHLRCHQLLNVCLQSGKHKVQFN